VGYVMANSRADDPWKVNKMFETFRVDYDFLPAYNLQLIEGRNFSRLYPTDQEDAVILTENAMHLFGFKNAAEAINGSIHLEGHKDKRFRVNGVVKDYHQLSLKEDYRPIVFMMYSPWNWINNHYVSVKLEANQAASFVSLAKKELKDFFPESSFDHFFLDDYFNRQYLQDIRYEQLVMFFSWLASFIVVLGIFSMSGFMLLKRKKEISIRKVNGAGTLQILQLLNQHFLKLLGIAFIAGLPVAWLGMHYWLQNFAYRTTVDFWILISTAFITLFVTVLTVTILSYKTAAQNPVHSLRCE
jgi:putative ABC transport system permease protein